MVRACSSAHGPFGRLEVPLGAFRRQGLMGDVRSLGV